nr:SUMF1/EgtB/PvdO family nonheme iron enzyme [Anaerolineae bacterium]
MSSKAKRLFISYRTTDAPIVDKIAQDLRLLKSADGSSRYLPWQDKHDLPAGVPHWWDAILEAIEACDLFVFHLTPDSLKSEVCRAELEYAHALSRPIIPVVLESAYRLDPKSGGYRVLDDLKPLIPSWLAQIQWLFYVGADFYGRFEGAVAYHDAHPLRPTAAARPLHPGGPQTHGHSVDLYEAACEYAHKLAFQEANALFRTLVQRNLPDFADAAAQWLEILKDYEELLLIDSRPRARFTFKPRWEQYLKLFPKYFLEPDEIFDPKGFAQRGNSVQSDPPPPVQPSPPTIIKPRSEQLMPAPFGWIKIPAGKGTMKTYENTELIIPTERYWIAKYPVTNAQYAVFIKDGGYQERNWWTEHGWEARLKGWAWQNNKYEETDKPWTAPRFWDDPKWNGLTHPVVGVSWYEAIAFCQWLSDKTGEKIMLPTEAQWQYAAQGDDGRAYPWGPKWDSKRCNHNVDNKGIGQTTA